MMMTTKRLTHGNIQNIAWLIYVTCTAFLASTVAAQQSALLTFGSQDRNRITLPDPRVVTCEDVSGDETTRVFAAAGLVDFAHMTIDAARQQLIVGARNHLLRLNLTDLTQLEMVKFAPDNLTVSICIAKGQPKDDCHNYIRVLLVQKDQVFACGTNAFAPQCSWRKVDHLDKVVSWVSGVAKCPYNPHQNATFIMTADNNFYSATVTDFTARDPAIYRMMGPSKYLRTVQYNSRWLNEPDFVSSFEIGEFVYFFFRETAIEYINCGKTVYSRVARICQNDGGGKFLLEDNWTTFLKARLNCSLSGSYPFYFNELQNTYYDDHEQLLYAIFTTSPTSIYGSAVCVYNLTSFDQAFSGPFKYQSDPQSAWNRVPNNSPNLQCSSGAAGKRSPLEMNQSPMQRLLVDAQKFQMMDRAVQPIRIEPLVVAENERFNQIIVDRVNLPKPSNASVNVLFLATLEGTINKMVVFPSIGSSSPLVCLVEQIQLPCNGEHRPIRSMRLDSTQKVMFVGTGDRIYRLPVHRCHRFFTKLQCFYAQDPYCGWSDSASKCLPIGHPNLSSCPVLKTPVDGAFCQWSAWQPCSQVGHLMENSQCSCRMRECDCPTPAYGGRTCTGRKVEVANCTVNGNWSDWSSWSGCSATCGHALKTRTRTCSNPKPHYGGRICVGDEIQFDSCLSVKCQDQLFSIADGHWSSWSDWSVCSTRCGGGHQSRTRTCNSVQPLMGGHRCMGNDREFRTCNHGQCDEVRKFSDWSPWLRTNSTKDGYTNERFRCVCKASVSDQTFLRPPQIKTLQRQCSPSGEDCETGHLSVPDVDGGWSPWSTWTECDALCGSGAQYRDRQCNSPSPSGSGRECQGHSRELRTCNTHSCQGQWSCWSDYGPCSVSCGQGRKWRKRQCESERPGNYYTQACRGGDLQEVTCTMPLCDGNDDWGEWGSWSGCSYDNVQHRRRNCSIPASSMIPDAVNLCHGSDIESRVCQYGDVEINLDPSSPPVLTEGQAGSSPMVQYYHLIIVGVICFLLGGIVVFIAMIHCHHYVFSSAKDGAACTVAEKCDVVSDFSYFPPVHPFITSSGSIQLDEAVHTATHSSQTALMDFRHYYHPPNT